MANRAFDTPPHLRILRALQSTPSPCETKSVLLRLKGRRKIRCVLFDRLATAVIMLLCPIVIMFRHQRTSAKRFIIELSNARKLHGARQDFVRRHIDKDLRERKPMPLLDGTKLVYSTVSRANVEKIARLWGIFLRASIASIFYRRPVPVITLPCDFLIIASLICLPDTESYIFAMFSVDSYLIARMNEICGASHVNASLGNSSSYGNHYTFLPESRMIICSEFQKEEVSAFRRINWILVKSTSFWGLEHIEDLYPGSQPKPEYDIGIYSSGEWARNEARFRLINPRYARRLPDNPANQAFVSEILQPLLDLERSGGASVKLYLHPYERLLMNRHGITPPYWNLVKAAGIPVDDAVGTSAARVYEARIGVALSSSMIFDRWHVGLEGLLYHGPENDHAHDPRFMGHFSENCFSSRKELIQKLRDKLGIASAPLEPGRLAN